MSDVQVVVALSLLSITFLTMFFVTYFDPPSVSKEVEIELLEPEDNTDSGSDPDEQE